MDGRTIVIIGGTGGIGLSAARALTAEGANAVVVGRNPDHAEQAGHQLGESGRHLAADATDPQTAERAIDLALEAFGRFDGLYHVAGGSGRRRGDGPLHELTDEGIEFTLQLNLTSLIYSNRAAARRLMEQGAGGSVVNMTSVLGFSPSPRHFATHTYAATKSAAIGLTRAAASHYAPYGIRFNALAPALVETPMARRAAGDEAIMQYVRTKQPLDGGRIGRPDDLDGAAVFLLSERSAYMTGQVLTVDGGWTVSEGQYAEG